jgi:hypothetical protein
VNKQITKAGHRCIFLLLSSGPLQRTREGWATLAGDFVALNTMAKLRKLGYVSLSADKRQARPSPKAIATATPVATTEQQQAAGGA